MLEALLLCEDRLHGEKMLVDSLPACHKNCREEEVGGILLSTCAG